MLKPLLFVLAMAPVQAAAEGAGARISIDLHGHVPVMCRASVDGAATAGARSLSGWLNEFCNNPGGHRVYLDHSPSLAGAIAFVDGTAVRLSASGATLLSQSGGPSRLRRPVTIDLPGENALLRLRVVPN